MRGIDCSSRRFYRKIDQGGVLVARKGLCCALPRPACDVFMPRIHAREHTLTVTRSRPEKDDKRRHVVHIRLNIALQRSLSFKIYSFDMFASRPSMHMLELLDCASNARHAIVYKTSFPKQ